MKSPRMVTTTKKPEKLYGRDLGYSSWRGAALDCAKEKFFGSHQWTAVWVELALTVAGGLVSLFWGWEAALNNVLLGAGAGLVLAVAFVAYDIALAPYWLAAQRDAEWAGALLTGEATVTRLAEVKKRLREFALGAKGLSDEYLEVQLVAQKCTGAERERLEMVDVGEAVKWDQAAANYLGQELGAYHERSFKDLFKYFGDEERLPANDARRVLKRKSQYLESQAQGITDADLNEGRG